MLVDLHERLVVWAPGSQNRESGVVEVVVPVHQCQPAPPPTHDYRVGSCLLSECQMRERGPLSPGVAQVVRGHEPVPRQEHSFTPFGRGRPPAPRSEVPPLQVVRGQIPRRGRSVEEVMVSGQCAVVEVDPLLVQVAVALPVVVSHSAPQHRVDVVVGPRRPRHPRLHSHDLNRPGLPRPLRRAPLARELGAVPQVMALKRGQGADVRLVV